MAETQVQTFDSREIWLAARKGSLGGSDVPALFGYGFDSPLSLWVQKRMEAAGEPEPEELNVRFEVGHAVEPVLARVAERDLGKAVIRLDPPVMYRMLDLPRFHVTPDALILAKRPGKIHRRSLHKRAEALASFKSWAVAGTEWSEGEVHPYALIQLQAEMLATGILSGYVTVLFGLGKTATLPVEYHASFGDEIRRRVSEFWEAVDRDVPPGPMGTTADDEALKTLYPRSRPTRIYLGPEWGAKLAEIQQTRAAILALETKEDSLVQAAKMEMGEAEEGIIPGSGLAFRWKSQTRMTPPQPAKTSESRPFRIVQAPREALS